MFDVLIEREERTDQPGATPEQRAALEARLKALVARIADRGVRDQYERELRQTLYEKNRKLVRELTRSDGKRASQFAGKRRDNTQLDWRVRERANERTRLGRTPAGSPAATALARTNELSERTITAPPREALLMLTLVNHPWLLEQQCEEVAELTLTSAPLERLREALLELLSSRKPS